MKKLTLTELNVLTETVTSIYNKERKSLRFGQIYMNELYKINPELYKHITREGVCDPFYNDKHIDAFLEYITVKQVL